jgi:pyridoxal phosphate enzyme (YggS family)
VIAEDPVAVRIADNLRAVEGRLAEAARAAGRSRADLVLVAVSKTRSPAEIALLAALGVADFGESRWQELQAKAAELAPSRLRWHFVGGLQRNKARAVAAVAGAVHSLDRAELCAPLARGADDAGHTLDVFCQVSLDGDPHRGGIEAAGLFALADAVAEAGPSLRLVGLMAVPPRDTAPGPAFARLRELGARLQAVHPAARALSAGMSGDLEAAVAEGATHLRVGTALFGPRA